MGMKEACHKDQIYPYHILVRSPYEKTFVFCDGAKSKSEQYRLLQRYKRAYGKGYTFRLAENV
ncbi:hypothetical protein IMZ31_24350 (plasmid) [Pontibacillus sp. ALD_SL1]|uniref:hypothetical protein n=1 Tax=Pontibacillus sp. ALD_SL1 TaxID=2777185 RepID=UPI001A95D6D2|nr:hypothetical protein [Pontibacillus sp. ALD_SL1]QST02585.1 hypothetical protein IMZ31_24350 [Pontibacillus sp. ALD_SL1]